MILLLSVLDICTVSLKSCVQECNFFLKLFSAKKKTRKEKGEGKLLCDNLAV